MKKLVNTPFKKSFVLTTAIMFLGLGTAFAKSETEDKKPKNSSAKAIVEKALLQVSTDSLKSTQKVESVADSATVKSKHSAPASYNILFQVIYRNSFSEIFEENK